MASAAGSDGTGCEDRGGHLSVSMADIVDLAASVVKMREIAYYFDSVVQDCKEEAPAWLDELDDETRDVLIALSRVVELKPRRDNKYKKFDLRNYLSDWRDGDDCIRTGFRAIYEASTLIEPAFGKRAKVKFDDGVEYWGIICNHGTKRSDVEHPDGRWHVLFDDQTEGRFDDDDTDVTVTDDPMLKRVEWPLQNFYMRHHNGKKLLELIHNPTNKDDMLKRREKLLAERSPTSVVSSTDTAAGGQGSASQKTSAMSRHVSGRCAPRPRAAPMKRKRTSGVEVGGNMCPTRERHPTPTLPRRR